MRKVSYIVVTILLSICVVGCSNTDFVDNAKTTIEPNSTEEKEDSILNSKESEVKKQNTDSNEQEISNVNTQGNSFGNISNMGYVAQQGEWIYYNNQIDGLYKIKLDNTEKTQLCTDYADYINVVGDWIYYRNTKRSENNKYMVEGNYGLYKIKVDGTERKELDSGWCNSITVIGEWIYYTRADLMGDSISFLSKIKVDGSGAQIIYPISAGRYINIVDDWIYFEANGIARVKTNGEGYQVIITDEYLAKNGTNGFQVIGDCIYYFRDRTMLRAKLDGTDIKEVMKTSGIMNCYEGYIYYAKSSEALYKVDLKELRKESIIEDTNTMSEYNLTSNRIYYVDSESGSPVLYRVQYDGSQKERIE